MKNKIVKSLLLLNDQRLYIALGLCGLTLWAMYKSFILFHSYIEIYTVILSASIFIVIWNSRKIIDNNYLVVIGISMLFISIIDISHTLAYKGLELFPNFSGSNLPTQLWVNARFLTALSFLIASLFINKKMKLHGLTAVVSLYFKLRLTDIFFFLKIKIASYY